MYTVLLDTSVLISAMLSPKGASFQILELCRAGFVKIVISDLIVAECNSVIMRKMPQSSKMIMPLIKKSKMSVISLKKSPLIRKARKWITDEGDAHVLAAAYKAKVDYLITLDIRDFIWDKEVSRKSGLAITTPGDFMTVFRSNIPLEM